MTYNTPLDSNCGQQSESNSKGSTTTIGRKSEWWIVGSLLTKLSIICFSLLRSNVLTATYCRAATVSASVFERKKATRNGSLFVRTKGLEPPRLSASDPKSDVATNYTMSAGSRTPVNQRVCSYISVIERCKGKNFLQYTQHYYAFSHNFFYFCILNVVVGLSIQCLLR